VKDGALSPAEATDLRYLDPQRLRFLRHGATLRLIVEDERCWLKVAVFRTFPLSQPQRFLSVRDGAKKEIGLLAHPEELNADSRQLLAEELGRRYLVPAIRRVMAVTERFGTVEWKVETDRGPCTFTTRNPRENVWQPSPGRYLLTDVDGNRYNIRDLAALDAASQALLRRYL
jgi:Domain of unknown function (DUF1854)